MNHFESDYNDLIRQDYDAKCARLAEKIRLLQLLNGSISHNLLLILEKNRSLNDKRRALLSTMSV